MFDYHLPPERIAQHPARPRDASRLLVSLASGCLDRHFCDLPELLEPGDLLVLNDTRVLPARLFGAKPTGGKVELLLLRPLEEGGCWLGLMKSNRRVKMGDPITINEGFTILPEARDADGVARLRLICKGDLSPHQAIMDHGKVPLPPYIASSGEDSLDRARYQTVFARESGAVAAPTAGLHFTEPLLDKIKAMGVGVARVTLHVGLGTFQPLREGDPDRHAMHSEWRRISPDVAERINQVRDRGGSFSGERRGCSRTSAAQ